MGADHALVDMPEDHHQQVGEAGPHRETHHRTEDHDQDQDQELSQRQRAPRANGCRGQGSWSPATGTLDPAVVRLPATQSKGAVRSRVSEMSANRGPEHTIVVAVDNTPSGTAALRWAASWALTNGDPLSVVGVHETDPSTQVGHVDLRDQLCEARARFFALMCERLGTVPQHTAVQVSMRSGQLATALSESAEWAAMLVVGEPRTTAHRNLPEDLARRCSCRVTVVDEQGHARELGRKTACPAGTRRM
jgi:nucleotide-binding universal stress UspA family protein